MLNFKNLQGTPGFEPGTSRSAVECSTTELYPLAGILKLYVTKIVDLKVNSLQIETEWGKYVAQ